MWNIWILKKIKLINIALRFLWSSAFCEGHGGFCVLWFGKLLMKSSCLADKGLIVFHMLQQQISCFFDPGKSYALYAGVFLKKSLFCAYVLYLLRVAIGTCPMDRGQNYHPRHFTWLDHNWSIVMYWWPKRWSYCEFV